MELLFFWIKIAIKRLLKLFISSPVIIIWVMIIIASFIYAAANKHIEVLLDERIIILMIPFLVLISLFRSLKSYYVMPVLIYYSKSRIQNNTIYIIFFIKQAFVNNIWLLIFNIIIINFIDTKKYTTIILTATAVSFVLSFLLMYLKNNLKIKKTRYKELKKIKISPLMKSAIYDYFTPDFFAMAVVCIALFFVVIIEIKKDANSLYGLKNQFMFFIGLTIILSIGFMGIIDSIKNINWRFQAIISPNTFTYHIKRTMLFLVFIFGWLLLLFIFIGATINIMVLFKYLYCILMLFCITVFIAFTISNMLIKAITLSLIIAFTVWISTLPIGFLPILAIPFLAALLKAKNEYREWYLV